MKVFNFERLKDHEILTLLKRIIKKESLSITEDILAKIATNSHGDARSAINDLEGVAFGAISADITFSPRNQEQNLNQVLTNIFMAKDLQSAKKAIEGADLDYRELLMYVYEHAYKQAANNEETLNMYELISEADFYLSQCYIKQEWKFLKYFFQFISSVGLVKESSFKYSNFGFPSYWGLMGKLRMRKAKIKKLSDKAEQKLHSSTKLFENDIYPYLRIIFRTDPRMAAGIAVWLRFDQDDVDFLTGGSNKVTQEIMKHHELAYQQMAETWITEIKEVKPINILDFTKKPKKRGIKPIKTKLQTPPTKDLSQTKPEQEKIEKTTPVLEERDKKGKKEKKKKPSQASLEKFFN
jgi:replication factor C large subunit